MTGTTRSREAIVRKMIEVLMATELTAEQAASTADAVLAKRG